MKVKRPVRTVGDRHVVKDNVVRPHHVEHSGRHQRETRDLLLFHHLRAPRWRMAAPGLLCRIHPDAPPPPTAGVDLAPAGDHHVRQVVASNERLLRRNVVAGLPDPMTSPEERTSAESSGSSRLPHREVTDGFYGWLVGCGRVVRHLPCSGDSDTRATVTPA